MAFTLSLLQSDGAGPIHVAAEGEATAIDFPASNITRHFESLLGAGWSARQVLLNMERVPYCDSSAIGWLIHSQRAFRAGGGKLVLHTLQPGVRNVLEMLKIGRIIPIAPNAAAGKLLFESTPAVLAR